MANKWLLGLGSDFVEHAVMTNRPFWRRRFAFNLIEFDTGRLLLCTTRRNSAGLGPEELGSVLAEVNPPRLHVDVIFLVGRSDS